MEISVEKLVRDEHRVETAMDLAETRIFLKYPEERKHKAEYRRFIAEHASKIMGFPVDHPDQIEEELSVIGDEVDDGIESMRSWIKEYEKFNAGNRGPIDTSKLMWWPEMAEVEEHFSGLDIYVYEFTRTALEKVQEWQEGPFDEFEKTIAKAIEVRNQKIQDRWSREFMLVPLNPDVAVQLAVVWIPEMLSSRRLALEDLYNDVVVDIAVLDHLATGEYTTVRQAREAAFIEQASKTGAFPTENNMPWTLREVVTRFAFMAEWARERAKTGDDLDKPANLGRLPAEMIETLYKIMTNMKRNQPTSDTFVPRTYLKDLDMGMEHIVDRINAIARPHNIIIDKFVQSRRPPVDVSRKRLDHAVSVAKMLLQVVNAQPDGDSARAIFEKHGVRIRTIRRLLVNDMEWLLDQRHQTIFIDRMFDGFGEPTLRELWFVDTPITRSSAAEVLDSTVKKWLRNMDATLNMVLRFWGETKYWVDQKQSDGEERMRKKLCLPSTARATRRGQALKAWIATLTGTAKSPDKKPHASFASVFV